MMRKRSCKNPSGNALLLAIVVTMLLFILGMAFLSSMMTEKTTARQAEYEAVLDHGVEKVIARINDVLVQDLFGNDGILLNGDKSDEPYDYPGAADPWLASLEPEFMDTGTNSLGQQYPFHYYWPHITDLWNKWDKFIGNVWENWRSDGFVYYDPDDPANPSWRRSDDPLCARELYVVAS